MKKVSLSLLVHFMLVLLLSMYNAQADSETSKSEKKDMVTIASQDFMRPLWYQRDVIINAGNLGRYRFSEDSTIYELPEGVKIRPHLIVLLNALQKEFNTPIIIMSGYRSQIDDLYLWAEWLNKNPAYIKALNEKNLKSWSEWVEESQKLPGCFPIRSKYQTGDVVDFYWKTLDFQTKKKRDIMVNLIKEIGGSRNYTDAERKEYNIAPNDNSLFRIEGYMPEEMVTVYNPSGRCYFHVEFQPSPFPPAPNINLIGKKLSETEDMRLVYKIDEIILVPHEDFLYLAKIAEDSDAGDLEVKIHVFCEAVQKDIGGKILKSQIWTRREKPENGWGTRKVMLEYLSQSGKWEFAMDVVEYEDYFMVPGQESNSSKVEFNDIRIPIPTPRSRGEE